MFVRSKSVNVIRQEHGSYRSYTTCRTYIFDFRLLGTKKDIQ